MTKEKNYFICRNEECKIETNSSGEYVFGGKVIEYANLKKGQTFVCKHCKSKYKEENGNILLVFEKEVIFEDSDGFTKFQAQFEANRIHFRKLVLKNINEYDYNGQIFSFNKCRIDELVIEDVNITSAFYPIIFSECRIDKIRISKSRIFKATLSNYKSLWSFFGITFFQTVITENFIIDGCETSIAISNCAVKCSLDFSKESKADLALIHNERDPEVNTDKGSVVKRLFEATGRGPPRLPKRKSRPQAKLSAT